MKVSPETSIKIKCSKLPATAGASLQNSNSFLSIKLDLLDLSHFFGQSHSIIQLNLPTVEYVRIKLTKTSKMFLLILNSVLHQLSLDGS